MLSDLADVGWGWEGVGGGHPCNADLMLEARTLCVWTPLGERNAGFYYGILLVKLWDYNL